jgi:hypothetical protein
MLGALQNAGDDDGRGFRPHDVAGILVGRRRHAEISPHLGGGRHQIAPVSDPGGGVIHNIGASFQH